MNKSTHIFQTNYKTNYTEPDIFSNDDKFMSKYAINESAVIISGKSRPENMRYKSRLVEKE